jgi:7,8-dihydroneopterin aldolase/epimerase/oxygenase
MSALFKCSATHVKVEGLVTPARVGLHADERGELQPVSIDITCELSRAEVPGDDLGNSLDYVPLVRSVRRIAAEQSRRLIETLAEEVALVCFGLSGVESVTVSVSKPQKLDRCAAVGVTRTFTRKED